MSRLKRQIPLTFVRFGNKTSDSEGNRKYEVVEEITAKGALQPYRLGDTTTVIPEGRKTSDFKLFYTKTPLRPSDSRLETIADECEINGIKYEVYDAGDWSTNLSRLAHFKVVLARKETDD